MEIIFCGLIVNKAIFYMVIIFMKDLGIFMPVRIKIRVQHRPKLLCFTSIFRSVTGQCSLIPG